MISLEEYLQFLEQYWQIFEFPKEPKIKKEYKLIFL